MRFFVSEIMTGNELKEAVRSTGCGIELIQLSIPENLDNLEDTVRKTRDFLHFLGNPPCTVHGPSLDLNPVSYDERIRDVSRRRFEQAYEGAARLGAEKIVFHSGHIPGVHYLEGWSDRMARFWVEFLDGKQGIGVCMENVLDHETAPFLDVAVKVNHLDFGICLDVGHAHCYSRHSVEEWVETLRDHITHLHIHDNKDDWDYHLAVGDGTIPFDRILPAFSESDITVTFENTNLQDFLRSFNQLRCLAGPADR